MAEKKSFMLYFDNESQFDMLTDEQAGKLIKALLKFAKRGETTEFTDGMLKMAFSFISAQIQRDALKYDETCKKRAENIKKRWNKQDNTNEYTCIQNLQKHTNNTDTDKDIEKEIETEKETDIGTEKETDTDKDRSGDQSPEPPVGGVARQEKKSESQKALQEVITAYTQNPELQNALAGFVEMRKQIKKPLTERAMKSCLKKLDQLASADNEKITVVDQSIEHCWQTFYEHKLKKDNYGGTINGNEADIWNAGII